MPKQKDLFQQVFKVLDRCSVNSSPLDDGKGNKQSILAWTQSTHRKQGDAGFKYKDSVSELCALARKV